MHRLLRTICSTKVVGLHLLSRLNQTEIRALNSSRLPLKTYSPHEKNYELETKDEDNSSFPVDVPD
ncbi:MAG TPA: hypothetical protein VJ781_12565, partial [Pyrinomonadaceae bacterium]|nr:hypothetical protein [Pyrinomonadaceae bacterium]